MSRWIRQRLSCDELHAHRVTTVRASGRTAVQDWEVVELGGYGPALLLDGCIQSARGDEACYHEALHMPVQMAHPQARRVLLIGGANGGSLPRVQLLSNLEHVTLIDVDRELYAVSRDALAHMHGDSLDDPRLRMIFGAPDDEAAALAAAGETFDLIVADTPDPTAGSYATRLFAKEKIGTIAELLAPDGLFVTQVGQAHPLSCRLAARVLRTLELIFAQVVVYTHSVPSFGVPWCFAIGGQDLSGVFNLDSATIDDRILRCPPGTITTYDGATHRHMFSLPRFFREALAGEAGRVDPITLADPESVVVSE